MSPITLRPAAYAQLLEQAAEEHWASRIAAGDPTLWGPAATDEARRRLAWTRLSETSRALLQPLTQLRAKLQARGLTHVVLCGMGGSSLAPEVICADAGVPLVVLDSTDPSMIRRALADRLEETVVVVSSKSGNTLETDSQRRAYESALTAAGLDPRDHIVVVTDPGSPLDQLAREAGYEVINADPRIGGRFSALSAYGLVPSALAGVDVEKLLTEAAGITPLLETDAVTNPGLRLGVFLGLAAHAGADKLLLTGDSIGLADWIEQLVAESTGKDGTGILPIVGGTQMPTSDTALVSLSGEPLPGSSGWVADASAPLGAAFLLWEYATAVAGCVLKINPFDQPDVEQAKDASRGLLSGSSTPPAPLFRDGAIEVYASPGLLTAERTAEQALATLLASIDPNGGYLAVMAYLDRVAHRDLSSVQSSLAQRTWRPTTFGWGPRFLHSTGQFHKGGPTTGAFLQVTSTPPDDLVVPGRSFTFGGFLSAQAVGDGTVLAGTGQPVLRLHLTDETTGVAQVRRLLA